jgi:hypothetical protein
MADKLNAILNSYIAQDGTSTKDKLVGAAFVVVSKDGITPSQPVFHPTGN